MTTLPCPFAPRMYATGELVRLFAIVELLVHFSSVASHCTHLNIANLGRVKMSFNYWYIKLNCYRRLYLKSNLFTLCFLGLSNHSIDCYWHTY